MTKYIRSIAVLMTLISSAEAIGQVTVQSQHTLILPNHNIGLVNPLFDEGSPLSYYPDEVEEKGGAFTIQFNNPGGSDFKGYPNGSVGGFREGSTYYPGNVQACGMPVRIQQLTNKMRINWKIFQHDAADADDKWWATINVIFDEGTANSEPDPEARDFDLVIQQKSYLQDDFSDFTNAMNTVRWYFARNADGSIKPYTLFLNGVPYSWGVRYKFFNYPPGDPNEAKNDKVHIKFIPIDNSSPMPWLDHPLKGFINCAKNYLQYVGLTPEEQTLAQQKVALPSLWIKSVAAGYEVYEGNSTLGNEYFFIQLDQNPPEAPENLTSQIQNDEIWLQWDAVTDEAFDSYQIYRAEGTAPFQLLASQIFEPQYTDASALPGIQYKYYVTATDRSLNVSPPSNTAISSTTGSALPAAEGIPVSISPNPFHNTIIINNLSDNEIISLYDISGRNMSPQIVVHRLHGSVQIDASSLPDGLYVLRTTTFSGLLRKE